MSIKTKTLNSWPAGISNIAPDNAPPKDQYGRVNGLRDAVNVDVLTSGKLRRRAGIRQIIPDPNAHSLYSFGSMMMWATPTTLKVRRDGIITTVLTSAKLANPISYVTVNGRTYWSNEDINGIINLNGTYEPWGITPPVTAPGLMSTPGRFMYQVTCTFVTASGEESGAPLAAQITTGELPSIRVINIPQSSDSRVVATRLYVTNTADGIFNRVMDVPAGITIATLAGFFDSGAALKTQFMQPPPPGQFVDYNNGIIVIATGSNLAITRPLQYGLHDPAEDFFMYSERITLLKAVPDGIYVSTDQVYFLPSVGTDDVTQIQTLPARAIEGAVCSLPETEDIMFVTDRGFILGGLSGQTKNLTESLVAVDLYPHGTMGYIERNGHKEVVAIFADGKPNPAVSEDFRAGDLLRKAARA